MGCALGKSSKVSIRKQKCQTTRASFDTKREELLSTVFSLYSIKSRCLADIEHYKAANDKLSVLLLRKKERCINENLAVIRMIISKIDECLLDYSEYSRQQIKALENVTTFTLEKIKNSHIFDKKKEFLGDKGYEESINAELQYHGLNLNLIESEILSEIKPTYENASGSISDASNVSSYVRKKYIKVRK